MILAVPQKQEGSSVVRGSRRCLHDVEQIPLWIGARAPEKIAPSMLFAHGAAKLLDPGECCGEVQNCHIEVDPILANDLVINPLEPQRDLSVVCVGEESEVVVNHCLDSQQPSPEGRHPFKVVAIDGRSDENRGSVVLRCVHDPTLEPRRNPAGAETSQHHQPGLGRQSAVGYLVLGVARAFELVGDLGGAGADDTAIDHHVNLVDLDVAENAAVVGDDHNGQVGAA